ncbi:hypothetical protein UFOVP48_43 [uncultured Caudovirales phage]|uniref:Uncharacterized protein n=1 Tax=uncultured Caudovirales phage TaxID=2100421 RepID=A0A6J5KQU8_9CAUD|nr:hypothetical protein UFOVP48_43 [uncultured Caudovirales phage]
MTLAEALQKAVKLGIEVRIEQPASRAATLDMKWCFTEHWGDHGGSAEKATIRAIERVIERNKQ